MHPHKIVAFVVTVTAFICACNAFGAEIKTVPEPTPGVFTGTWKTNIVDLFLTQSGNEVSGSYAYEGGTLKGLITGNRLDYAWTQTNGKKGKGYFIISDDGKTISGRYGYNDDNAVGGEWKGEKAQVPVSP